MYKEEKVDETTPLLKVVSMGIEVRKTAEIEVGHDRVIIERLFQISYVRLLSLKTLTISGFSGRGLEKGCLLLEVGF
jgi:hypothetical protein